MFIFTSTQRRANPEAPYVDSNGVRYVKTPMSLLTEIPEPAQPVDYSEENYYRVETNDAPYVVYTKKSDEQIMEIMLQKTKLQRVSNVQAITVTTIAGNTFDGDEVAQGRMARAIVAMDDADVTQWILADNSIISVSKAELKEALKLAGQAMTAIWVNI